MNLFAIAPGKGGTIRFELFFSHAPPETHLGLEHIMITVLFHRMVICNTWLSPGSVS